MYSGYEDANANGTHHLFYWMYRNSDPNANTVVWLNGGPGSSSMFGNFLENGPLQIFDSLDTETGLYTFNVTNNPQGSWADTANLIFIDQPINTGFSYSDTPEYLTTMDELSEEFVHFMANLYLKYPSLLQNTSLYMTGESYGGKYLPVFSNALLDSDANSTYNVTFNVQGTLVGDPYTAPLTQRTSVYEVPYALNIIDETNLPQVSALIRRC
jgi:carboxypeptidase C (cathepsin A)